MGGFALACVDRLFFLTAASCVDLTFFFFCRALDFGSRVGFGATSRRILGLVAVNDKEG